MVTPKGKDGFADVARVHSCVNGLGDKVSFDGGATCSSMVGVCCRVRIHRTRPISNRISPTVIRSHFTIFLRTNSCQRAISNPHSKTSKFMTSTMATPAKN
ncbi:hypothetical protein L1987_51568 [Smallanthus sonchifolius]|uniref:Uncharacterized protein n=1 Tax=Smallanthus sonchifolius TaxID=185202 RepID=A0ACB9EQC5_9ASTR|nr:hypothetical protein L1987_51568 [Smallanthus sonchifolius]